MYDENVEQEVQAMLCDLERDKLAAEGKLMAARTAIEETDQAIMSVRPVPTALQKAVRTASTDHRRKPGYRVRIRSHGADGAC